MRKRGLDVKTQNDHSIKLERAMVTRHYIMTWDLDRCVGCQMGPYVCPKEALQHIDGIIENGHLVQRPKVDVDPTKCVMCGMCIEVCPVSAIEMTVNGKEENPVIDYEAFPKLEASNQFNPDEFDWSLKDFVIENCPTGVISESETEKTLQVDQKFCIHCRQCEIASNGAFAVLQPWQGNVTLDVDKCLPGCQACADICPTRALHVDDHGKLILADYYCIKCGACMHTCPIKAEFVDETFSFESQGISITRTYKKLVNEADLAIKVERWRARHKPVKSAAWIEALRKLADDKASSVELDRIRALKRKDLIYALKGHILPENQIKQ